MTIHLFCSGESVYKRKVFLFILETFFLIFTYFKSLFDVKISVISTSMLSLSAPRTFSSN